MLHLITAVLMGAAPAAAVPIVDAGNLPEVFAATCLDGAARVPAGSITKVSFDDLPSKLRSELGRPSSGDVWRVNTSGRAYLYVLNYAPTARVNPKICGLAADEMSMKAATDLLDLRLAGSIYAAKRKTTQWLRAEDGYFATATTAGDFHVLQVNWLSDQDRTEAMKELQPVSR